MLFILTLVILAIVLWVVSKTAEAAQQPESLRVPVEVEARRRR